VSKKTLTTILMLSLLTGASWAQTSNTKRPPAKKKAAAPPKKVASKTIGDVLKNIEKKSEAVKFQKSQSALPKIQQQQLAPAKVTNLRQVKPPSSSKLYYEEGTDEAQLMTATDDGINQLFKLTQQYQKSARRGELWLRLAEQYVEKARLIEYQILNKHDSDNQAFQAGKLKNRPKLNLAPATEYNKKAIQLYEWFLRDFPKDPKVDQALFFLGFNYFEINETKKGQVFYERLTKEFPRSLYVSESNFALGEYHFEGERWKDALVHYTRVAQQKNSRLFSFALYKMAWCHYKLNDSRKALSHLEQVILEGRRSKGQKDASIGGVSRIRLATEAIKDLILFFAEAGDPTKARDYFEKIIGEKSVNINLAKLAYYYSDTGNRNGARHLFRDLIDQDPNSIKAYDYQYAVVKMFSAAGPTSPAFKQELYAWIEQYGPGSSWQKINAKDVEAIKKANELMESLLRNNILQQHQVAQNARTKTAIANAKGGYELYFQTFNEKTSKIEEMHFFYGELLFDNNDYDKAAIHYIWVVDNAPQSQYYDKALLNSLLAYEKRLPSEDRIKKMVGSATEPIEFDASIKAFEVAARRFLEKAPRSENAVAVRYRMGALYYLFNQFDKAEPILTDIVKNHSQTTFAKYSANHLLDIYNLKKDYTGLQATANMILSIPALARSEVGAQVKSIKLQTDFKLAKDLENKKDYLASAKAYEEFAKKNTGSEMAPGALFNSAVNYERAGEITKAIASYTIIAGNRAKSFDGLRDKANKFLPVLYEKTGQYVKAAQMFESYAVANPKDSVSSGYHYNAAVIYDGLNAYSAAIKNYETYFNKTKGRDRLEVLFLIAKIYQRQGLRDRAIGQFDKYINSGTGNAAGVVEATFAIAKLHEQLKRKKVTEEWYQKTVAVQRRLSSRGTTVGASFAAEARFNLISKTYDELVATRLPANPAAQGKAVQAKLALVNRLKDELKSVVAYDDGAQIVAALTLQGQALQHMYTELLNAPVPKGLKPEELKQYKEGVQKIADPFKAQALETFKTAIDRGHELLGYTQYLKVALKNYNILQGKTDALYNTRVIMTKLPDGMGI